jgi:hypothetical protein
MDKDEEDFWSSSSVSSTTAVLNFSNNNDNDYSYKSKDQKDENIDYEKINIILPNLGYSNENKSFIFKFSTVLKEINGYKIPRIININLSNQYNFCFNEMYLNITPLKYEYYDGLVVEIKYLKSKNIPNDILLAFYAKKIELYLLGLPLYDEIYINLGFKIKKEDIGHFCTINKNKNKKFFDDSINNQNNYEIEDDNFK